MNGHKHHSQKVAESLQLQPCKMVKNVPQGPYSVQRWSNPFHATASTAKHCKKLRRNKDAKCVCLNVAFLKHLHEETFSKMPGHVILSCFCKNFYSTEYLCNHREQCWVEWNVVFSVLALLLFLNCLGMVVCGLRFFTVHACFSKLNSSQVFSIIILIIAFAAFIYLHNIET